MMSGRPRRLSGFTTAFTTMLVAASEPVARIAARRVRPGTIAPTAAMTSQIRPLLADWLSIRIAASNELARRRKGFIFTLRAGSHPSTRRSRCLAIR